MPVVNPGASFVANVPSKGDKKASNADVLASLIELHGAARPRKCKERRGLGGIDSAIVSGKEQPHRGAAVLVEGEFVRRP
jgi:hypothetical protein